jgi:hypothetical protein
MGFAVAALAVAPGLARAQPADLFYERTVMVAVDFRCGLFAPDVAAALVAGAAQARGAALRAGASEASLRNMERVARGKAASASCGSSDITLAAARVKTGFSGYAKLMRLTYPGDVAPWQADRAESRKTRWRLAQETTFGADRLSFGLAGRDGPSALVAVAQFADGAEPYAARLLLRDSGRSRQPYLDRRGGGPTVSLPLDRRLPPPKALKGYAAAARSPAGPDLLPKNAKAGWAFRFPDTASRDLADLDPRESVAVEFLFAGDVSRRA